MDITLSVLNQPVQAGAPVSSSPSIVITETSPVQKFVATLLKSNLFATEFQKSLDKDRNRPGADDLYRRLHDLTDVSDLIGICQDSRDQFEKLAEDASFSSEELAGIEESLNSSAAIDNTKFTQLWKAADTIIMQKLNVIIRARIPAMISDMSSAQESPKSVHVHSSGKKFWADKSLTIETGGSDEVPAAEETPRDVVLHPSSQS